MDLAKFGSFSDRLAENLLRRPEVLGLVLLGSSAGTLRSPDRFSDHDFFVFTTEESAERLRHDLSWLPDAGRVVLVHRETAHGLKILLDDGHLCECAVFAPGDVRFARGDTWRVVFDRGLSLEAAMERTGRAAAPAPDPTWLLRQALFNLLVGAGRHLRGEKLSGHRLVFGEALPALARLFDQGHPDADPFDPLRRFEQRHPGMDLSQVLLLPPDAAALALLDSIERHLPGALPPEALDAVRRALAGP